MPNLPIDIKWDKPVTLVEAKPGAIPPKGTHKAVVTYVEDGDGANLKLEGGQKVICRFDKIDAPETDKTNTGKKGQPFGNESKKILEELILNKEVTLKIVKAAQAGPPTKDNNYGRSVCQIEFEGKDINLEMLKQGAAHIYTEYAKDLMYVQTQAKAKSDRAGLWAGANIQLPRDFRKANTNK